MGDNDTSASRPVAAVRKTKPGALLVVWDSQRGVSSLLWGGWRTTSKLTRLSKSILEHSGGGAFWTLGLQP